MGKSFIRFWLEEDLKKISAQLLIVGESFSSCASCKTAADLDFKSVRQCPECKCDFKYVTSRQASSSASERFYWLKRIKDSRPELIFIDYDDYKRNQGRDRARELLG